MQIHRRATPLGVHATTARQRWPIVPALLLALLYGCGDDGSGGTPATGGVPTGGGGQQVAATGGVGIGGLSTAGIGGLLSGSGGVTGGTGGTLGGTGGVTGGTGGGGMLGGTGGVTGGTGGMLDGTGGVTGGTGGGGTLGGTGGVTGGTGGMLGGTGGVLGGTGGVGAVATGGAGTGGIDGSGGIDATGGGGTGGGGTGEPETHIYLAVGQSNMQGAAHLPEEPVFHPRVTVLQDQNCPASDGNPYGYGEWREMFTPMIRCYEGTRDYPGVASGPIGLGPADSFAVAMAEAAGENVTIGIVGAAYGGTSITAHLPNCTDYGTCAPPFGDISGAPVVNGTTPIYYWLTDLARKAQEVGVIKGIVFHQGENDNGSPSWLGHVNEYVTALRNDLGLDPAEVPFIAGELPYTGCCAGHNALVQQIPDYVENGHWVSAGPMEDGTVLGDRGDSLHWSTFSVIEMGKRYAAKMLEVGNY